MTSYHFGFGLKEKGRLPWTIRLRHLSVEFFERLPRVNENPVSGSTKGLGCFRTPRMDGEKGVSHETRRRESHEVDVTHGKLRNLRRSPESVVRKQVRQGRRTQRKGKGSTEDVAKV